MVTRQKLKRDTGIQKVLRIRQMTPDTEHAVSNSFPFGVSLYRHTVPRIYWREAGLVLRDIAAAVAGRAMLSTRVCVCVCTLKCVSVSIPKCSRFSTACRRFLAGSSEYHYALAFVSENILVL